MGTNWENAAAPETKGSETQIPHSASPALAQATGNSGPAVLDPEDEQIPLA